MKIRSCFTYCMLVNWMYDIIGSIKKREREGNTKSELNHFPRSPVALLICFYLHQFQREKIRAVLRR